MREKDVLLNRTIDVLREEGYEVFLYGKCFDLLAKKEDRWLIRVLYNLDSFSEGEAKNMRIFSYFMSCYPFIVSEISNNGTLKDGVVYSRYNILSSNLTTFSKILKEKAFKSFAVKGKHLVKIDFFKLKVLRKEKGVSLGKLSNYLNISKKSLYEIENGITMPTRETAEKLEKFFETNLILSNSVTIPEKEIVRPKGGIEKKISFLLEKIGIENSFLNLNFNLVGKADESVMVVSKRIEKEEEYEVWKISQFLGSFTFYVGENETTLLPRLSLKKIEKITSAEELKEELGY